MLRDQALQYKERYAKNLGNTLVNRAYRGFFKYVAPSILMMLVASFVLFSYSFEVKAAPQGFNHESIQRSDPLGFGIEGTTPNTIKGVLANGRSDDYVVLEGFFHKNETASKSKGSVNIEQLRNLYSFADASGDSISVDISQSNNATLPEVNQHYYLWGTIQRNWFSTSIKVIEYTPVL